MDCQSHDKAADRRGRRSIVRQVARRLRYRTIDQLVGRRVTLRSLDTTLADIQAIVDEVFPGCVFAGPEERFRIGALAKYGLLDLRYDAKSEMAATSAHRGLSLLEELGFVVHPRNSDWATPIADDTFHFLADLLDDFDKNETLLKLFLEERPERPFPPPAEWETWFREPSTMPFPKAMEIVDACVTNSASVWLSKHFYM